MTIHEPKSRMSRAIGPIPLTNIVDEWEVISKAIKDGKDVMIAHKGSLSLIIEAHDEKGVIRPYRESILSKMTLPIEESTELDELIDRKIKESEINNQPLKAADIAKITDDFQFAYEQTLEL